MTVLQDIRHAVRWLRRAPAVTILATASIALSVGATAVVFTAVKAVLIEPFPYAHSDALVQLRTDFVGAAPSFSDWVSWSDADDVVRQNHTFSAVGVYHYALFNLAGDANSLPEALYGLFVTDKVFPMLGVAPMLGRNILPEEARPGRDREMILSYGLWQRRFHADPRVVGRTVVVNGHDCLIIGVMPPGFDFPMRLATTINTPSHHMDFWAPDGFHPVDRGHDDGSGWGAVARLRPGVTLAEAQQDVAAISARLAREYPRTNQGLTLRLAALRDRTLRFARTGLILLLAAALIFLLIGCANVANLLLARALARHREMAVRAALGAGRMRLLRQLITESCVLAAAGGLAGYALAVLAWRFLPALAPMSIPRLAAARPDGIVFAFALAVSLLNGILFGLVPALHVGRAPLFQALREAGARGLAGGPRNRLRSALVVGEVAIAVILVILGGTLTGGFMRLLRTDPGFDASHTLASIIVASDDRYMHDPAAHGLLFRRILASVRALPRIDSAGTVDALPFSGENNGGLIAARQADVLDRSRQQAAEIDRVSAGYLQTMGVRLLAGRWFRDGDEEDSRHLAIVNDIAAQRLWPQEDALGKRICVNCQAGQPQHWNEVIGVVSSIYHSALDRPPGPELYLSGGALPAADFLVVRTRRPSAEIAQAIRRAVAAVDPHQPVFLSATMATLIGDSLSDRRFIMLLLGLTGCLALLLAAAGVYGVVSYVTGRRTQEIGVRMALGATPRQVRALVFGQGMKMAASGIAIGILAALALTRALRHTLPGLDSASPFLFWTATVLVTAAAGCACWVPARRATRIDPAAALRQE
jgi:predicted permease